MGDVLEKKPVFAKLRAWAAEWEKASSPPPQATQPPVQAAEIPVAQPNIGNDEIVFPSRNNGPGDAPTNTSMPLIHPVNSTSSSMPADDDPLLKPYSVDQPANTSTPVIQTSSAAPVSKPEEKNPSLDTYSSDERAPTPTPAIQTASAAPVSKPEEKNPSLDTHSSGQQGPNVVPETQAANNSPAQVNQGPSPTSGPALNVVAAGAPTGLKGLALGAKYVGEETGGGWQQGRTKEGKPVQTDYFDEQRKQASKLAFSADGTVQSGNAAQPDGKVGFVADPRTGDLHQFKSAADTSGPVAKSVHHSSPLAGADVAGAGHIQTRDGRITNIDDQSGHYKPTADFTFQTVRLIDQKTMTEALRKKLKDTNSDTLEQGIAAAIQAERETFFKNLDTEMARKEEEFEDSYALQNIGGKDLEARMAEVQDKLKDMRQKAAAEFLGVARAVEESLRAEAGPSPLRDPRAVDPGRGSFDMGGSKANRETKVSLLGKTGAVSDAEYNEVMALPEGEREAAFNKKTALRQLAGPLGERAYAELAREKGAVDAALAKLAEEGVEDPKIDDLKKALGRQAVDSIKDNDDKIKQLSQENGVKSFTLAEITGGVEAANFKVGEATAANLTAEQFLQTGGSEAQIRNKAALNAEITGGLKDWRAALDKKAQAESEKPTVAKALEQDKLKKLEQAQSDLRPSLLEAKQKLDEQEKKGDVNRQDYREFQELEKRQKELARITAEAEELSNKVSASKARIAELEVRIASKSST